MDQNQIKERAEKILTKRNYKFHAFDEEKMAFYASEEATPTTAYYHQREKVDLMNDIFDAELKYTFDKENDLIFVEAL